MSNELAAAIQERALHAVQAARTCDQDGTISAYDPDNYAVKVLIQPWEYETGWIPIGTLGVGAGYGLLIGPELGQAVTISPIQGSKDNWRLKALHFNNVETPPNGDDAVQAGEFLLKDKSGSFVRISPANGTINQNSSKDTNQTVGANWNVSITGNVVQNVQGKMDETIHGDLTQTIDGNFTQTVQGKTSLNYEGGLTTKILGGTGEADMTASQWKFIGPIQSQDTVTVPDNDVVASGKSLATHKHTDPQGGTTGGPI